MIPRRALLAGLAGLPLLSCGLGGDAQAGEAPIRVGVLHSLRGAMAESGASVAEATRFAIAYVSGQIPGVRPWRGRAGVLGRPVEAVVRDGQSHDPTFVAEANALLDEGVSTIFGCWTSSSRKAVLPVLEARGGFLFYPVQHEGLEASPNALYLGALPNQQLLPAIRWAVDALGPRVALVGSDYVYPRVAHAIIADQLAAMGLSAVSEAYLPLDGAALPGRAAAAVAELGEVDVIASTLNGLPGNLAFLRALSQSRRRPPVLSFSVAEPEAAALLRAGVSVEGDYAAWTHLASAKGEPQATFTRALRLWRRWAGVPGPATISDPMAAAIASVLLWADAVEERGQEALSDPAVLASALRGRSVIGPQGEVHVDATTPHTWSRPIVGRFGPLGALSAVYTAPDLEAPHPFPGYRDRVAWDQLLARVDGGPLATESGPI